MFCAKLITAAFQASRLVMNHPRVIVPKLTVNPCIGYKNYSTLLFQESTSFKSLLLNPTVLQISNDINTRSVTKFSIRKGKRKSVKAARERFYRLRWGGWIRTIAGRHKKLFTKSIKQRQRIKQHVFCNATQSRLLDKMVGPYWRKPRYYVDDPYEPYHSREEFVYSACKPKPYFPPEN